MLGLDFHTKVSGQYWIYNREILKKILQGGDQNISVLVHTLDCGDVLILKYIHNFFDGPPFKRWNPILHH